MIRVSNGASCKIAEGFGGHTYVLALFDRSGSPGYIAPDAATSTIDHIAFEIRLADFETEVKDFTWKRLSRHGCIGAPFT